MSDSARLALRRTCLRNPLAASKRGHYVAMSIVRDAGLPPGDVVRLEAVRDDVLDKEFA